MSVLKVTLAILTLYCAMCVKVFDQKLCTSVANVQKAVGRKNNCDGFYIFTLDTLLLQDLLCSAPDTTLTCN